MHPGEVLLEELLGPLGLSQNRLGLSLGVHPRHVNEIVLGKRRVTAETALRLARYFRTTPRFWLGLQAMVRTQIYLTEEERTGLDAVAKATDRTQSEGIREAVDRFLDLTRGDRRASILDEAAGM